MVDRSDTESSVSFDAEYDVIVVGYGYSGGIAAIDDDVILEVDQLFEIRGLHAHEVAKA